MNNSIFGLTPCSSCGYSSSHWDAVRPALNATSWGVLRSGWTQCPKPKGHAFTLRNILHCLCYSEHTTRGWYSLWNSRHCTSLVSISSPHSFKHTSWWQYMVVVSFWQKADDLLSEVYIHKYTSCLIKNYNWLELFATFLDININGNSVNIVDGRSRLDGGLQIYDPSWY